MLVLSPWASFFNIIKNDMNDDSGCGLCILTAIGSLICLGVGNETHNVYLMTYGLLGLTPYGILLGFAILWVFWEGYKEVFNAIFPSLTPKQSENKFPVEE